MAGLGSRERPQRCNAWENMSAEPQLFRINPENRESEKIAEVEFASLGFQERRDIQEWIAANPDILDDDLLIIGKEFSGFDRTDERLDLLAVDADGKLVVIELKRDDSGADAHWQAIKYASYLQSASADDIVRMLTDYEARSEEDAVDKLLQHLGADDLSALNNDQRIILASHRFAPEVTSAALWLNEKAAGDTLLTCVQLTPFRDEESCSLYVQANTIIPVPGIDDYMIGIRDRPDEIRPLVSKGAKVSQTIARNKNDEISVFLRGVADRVINVLSDQLKPDRKSRWAGTHSNFRYYKMWYSRPHWGNYKLAFMINLYSESVEESDTWMAHLGFRFRDSGIEELEEEIARFQVYEDQWLNDPWDELLVTRRGINLDESFACTLAETLARFIEVVTPRIEEIIDGGNDEGS